MGDLQRVPVTLTIQIDGHGPEEVVSLSVGIKSGRLIHSVSGVKGVGVVLDETDLGLSLMMLTATVDKVILDLLRNSG